MKLLKTFKHYQLNYIETNYKKRYPTLLLKQPEFFNSINKCATEPVPIGYTYTRISKET